MHSRASGAARLETSSCCFSERALAAIGAESLSHQLLRFLTQIPKFGLVLDAPAFSAAKRADCPAIISFRYSDCETSGFPRTTTSTRRSPPFWSLGLNL